MNLEDKKTLLASNRHHIKVMQSENSTLRQEIADEVCPFKVGDRIVCIKSSSWGGVIKAGDEVEVATIRYSDVDDYRLRVYRVKKNGERYVNMSDPMGNFKFEAKS